MHEKTYLLFSTDDWVLCRVQKKGNISKKTLEVQDSFSTELMRYSPMIEKMKPTFTHCRTNMITDSLNQHCQVLDLIHAGQVSSPIECNSTATFRGSNSFISVYEGGSDKVNLPLLVPSSDNYFTTEKKKKTLGLGNKQENLILSEKKLNNNYKRNADFLPMKIFPKSDLNCASQNQSQDGIYNPYPTDSIIEFHKLNNRPSHIYAQGNEHFRKALIHH
ncbi:hypothetical protein CRYUN_Cryun25bG0067000 [Craigia yunnanensis]